jgi:TIR domain
LTCDQFEYNFTGVGVFAMRATDPDVTPCAPPEPLDGRNSVFISYAHSDHKWTEVFMRMLKPAIGDRLDVWADADIAPGEAWNSRIEHALKSAKTALLLVSDHFFASEYIRSVELPAILKRHESDGLKLFWVPITQTTLSPEFDGMQAACDPKAPLDGQPKPKRNASDGCRFTHLTVMGLPKPLSEYFAVGPYPAFAPEWLSR